MLLVELNLYVIFKILYDNSLLCHLILISKEEYYALCKIAVYIVIELSLKFNNENNLVKIH